MKMSNLHDKNLSLSRKLAFLVPNSITFLSLLFGCLAIKASIDGRIEQNNDFFVSASYFIIISGICDFLDGAIARMTKTTSTFGGQLDSLCDLVAFGVAPAFVVYNFILYEQGNLGFFLCFLLIASGAFRLARFNTLALIGMSSGFSCGIPIPMPAGLFAALILSYNELINYDIKAIKDSSIISFFVSLSLDKQFLKMLLSFYLIICSIGMVSTFKYFSNKNIKLPENKNLKIVAIGCIFVTVILLKINFVFSTLFIFTVYCIHGPLIWIFEKIGMI